MSNKKSNMKAVVVLLVLILMLMTGLIYMNNINGKNSIALKDVRSLAFHGQAEAENQNSMIISVDDLLVEAAGTVVTAHNIDGNAVWNKTMAGKVEAVKSAADKLYVLDNSNNIYCISKGGKVLWEKKLEGKVKSFYTERSGDVLIEYTYEGGTKIKIISGKGIDEGSLVLENAYVVSFASGNSENSISVVDISSQILKTKLLTLNLRGDLVWSDNLDNQVIPLLGYTKDNSLIAIGENVIYKYKDQSKKQSKLELHKTIYSAGIGEGGITAILRGKNGFAAISYDANLKELGSLVLDQEPIGIFLENNRYILYYREKLLLADTKGAIQAQYKSIPEIKKAYFGAEQSIILVSDRLIQKLGY